MSRKKITLDDIAKETGLSKFSVSRALAGNRESARRRGKRCWRLVIPLDTSRKIK